MFADFLWILSFTLVSAQQSEPTELIPSATLDVSTSTAQSLTTMTRFPTNQTHTTDPALITISAAPTNYTNETNGTTVVSSFVTLCPHATTFSTNGKAYTASQSEYVTITDCPCTIPRPTLTGNTMFSNGTGWGEPTGLPAPDATDGGANLTTGGAADSTTGGAAGSSATGRAVEEPCTTSVHGAHNSTKSEGPKHGANGTALSNRGSLDLASPVLTCLALAWILA